MVMKKIKVKSSSIAYETEADTLSIRFDDRTTAYSVNFEDLLIIDVTEDNKLAGVEYLGVSEWFDIDKAQLSNIDRVEIKVNYNEENKELRLVAEIGIKDKEEKIVMQPLKLEEPIIA